MHATLAKKTLLVLTRPKTELLKSNYTVSLKFLTPIDFAAITLQLEEVSSKILSETDKDSIENSEDADQTAPLGAV